MHSDIDAIYKKMRELEDQLEDYLDDLSDKFKYQFQNGRVKFDQAVAQEHRRSRVSLLQYIASARLMHIITAPVIYAMVIPLALLDITLALYQQICFRAYGVPIVPRWQYMIVDRNQLSYLNLVEKFNCIYCSYGNSVVAYAREVLARTEQYWCPIKHAQKLRDAHERYMEFSEFGDAENYREDLNRARDKLKQQDQ